MSSLFDKPFTFDRVARIVLGVTLISGVIYVIALLRNALLPFLIAWLLAYLIQPLVRFFQYKVRLKSRILSIIAVLLSIVLGLSLVGWVVVPAVTEEAGKVLELLQRHNEGYGNISMLPQSWVHFMEEHIKLDELPQLLNREHVLSAVKQLAPKLWVVLQNTFSILFSITILFVIFLYFIFILLDYEQIAEGWVRMIPERYRPFVMGVAEDLENSMNCYFRGQLLIALCVGILLAVGFKIIGFPMAVILGLFIGLLNLIPYMQTFGIIPMVLLSLLKAAETGGNFWLIFGSGLLVLGIVQCIQDLFLTPRIMGRAMGMNPAIILLSLSVWGTLLGFAGLIVALPLTTLCISYYKRFILMEDSK